MGSMGQSPTIARIHAEQWARFGALDNWPDRIAFLREYQSINMARPVQMPDEFMEDLARALQPQTEGVSG